ncbi:MAG: RNA polymerase sigma factor [Verrucomicrobium sp.]|nr:RNA polymerase sigma factor [Verrucomicrobium sp.]
MKETTLEPADPALEAWVQRAQAGEEAAQQFLVESYQRRLGGFVYGLISQSAPVDDLCQAIFVKMVLSLPKLRETARFEPWLFRLARNHCLSYLRREKFRRLFFPLSETHHEVAAPPAPAAEPPEDLIRLRAALAAMPEKERALLLLAQDRDGDYRQAAETLGLTVGAFKTRVHRARRALKERMERMRKQEEADEDRRRNSLA